MDQGLGSQSNTPHGSIDKSRVLDVKPLRRLVPVFPNPAGMSSLTTPHPMPFTCISPSGPFPPGVQPFYPFMAPNDAQHTPPNVQNGNFGFGSTVQSPVPLNSFRTPTTQENGTAGRNKRPAKNHASGPVMEDDGYNDNSQIGDAGVGSNSGNKRINRAKKRVAENRVEFDFESLVNSFLTSFKLNNFEDFKRSNSEKEIVETVLLAFDTIRRKLTQLEEAKDLVHGIIKQPGPKAGALLTSRGIRANHAKRVGHVPGIEIGDIFFFRLELCIVGLHAPTMAGIDYMSVKLTMDEEPVAVSIVSSGGYDDDGGDGDVLIYTGHGGVQRPDGQMFDQKLERGNLALEKSLHRGNDVRVIRGIKDILGSASKIYVYDGLYKLRESWVEKNKLGCNVFKYKLVRVPGQVEAFSLWKSIQQWKDGTSIRTGVILPDLTSGGESQPVALVNEVDGEKGPNYFTYISSLKYTKPFFTSTPFLGCNCKGGCQPGDANCPCNRKNEGLIPYSSLGILLTDKPLIHECGKTCACPPNCRNRISQAGIKVRLEVFKTKNRGWGLRSWDPIRAGGFVCEYAGDAVVGDHLGNESDDNNFIFDATRYYEPLEKGKREDYSSGFVKAPFPLVINAKNNGNVARFMNHSCSPNVFWRPVLRESNNESCLHVAFFAIRHIPPMQELTYDYGIVRAEKGDPGKKSCLCGSVKCRGYFY